MEYTRSTPPRLVDSIFRPIFLRSVPERKPRTEWACQPVAFIQFGQGRALGLFQKGDDAGALAGLAGRGGLGLGAAFRRLLAPTRLAGRLCFCGRGRWLSGRRACFTQFCRLGSGCGLILLLCSPEFDCSLGGSYRSHDIHGSDGAAHQAKSEPCTRASWETAERMARAGSIAAN